MRCPVLSLMNFIGTISKIKRTNCCLTLNKYQRIVNWGIKARGHNPNVFDALTEWILDDSEWTDDKLVENEQILMQGILARFRHQNAQLRAYLKEIEPSGIVNEAVFNALDRFDDGAVGQN